MLERWVLRLGVLYLVLLAAVIGYGLWTYGGEMGGWPIETLWHQAPPEVAAWKAAYGRYLHVTPILLGIAPGLWTGLVGLWGRSLLLGLAALLMGVLLTGAAYALLPRRAGIGPPGSTGWRSAPTPTWAPGC